MTNTSKTLFRDIKAREGKLMEVQSTILGDRMFVAANYTRGEPGTMSEVIGTSYSYSHTKGEDDTTTYTFTGKKLLTLVSTLHAEQQLLRELAKVLKNDHIPNPPHVTIAGTKRPCSTCRRVLLAFDRALRRHYPEVNLHFIDKTGQDTGVEVLDLSGLTSPTDTLFNSFIKTYEAELAKYQKISAGHLLGEEGTSSDRTGATPTLADLT